MFNKGTTSLETMLFFIVLILAAILLANDSHAQGVLGLLRYIVLFIWKVLVGIWGLLEKISP